MQESVELELNQQLLAPPTLVAVVEVVAAEAHIEFQDPAGPELLFCNTQQRTLHVH
jgi:hypothetical protein